MKRRVVMAALLAALFVIEIAAKDTLAVLPFTGGADEEGEAITGLFSFSNELNEAFAPIPYASVMRAIREERKFQKGADMTSADAMGALGKRLGANYVIAGNIAKLEDQSLLIISILKIDDLRQIAGDIQTYATIEEIQDKLPDMARDVIAATRIDSSKLDKLAVLPVALGGGSVDTRVADTLAQILSINLIKSGKYAVYPRTATLEQAQSEYSDQEKGENPRFALSVAVRRLGSKNMLNAALVDFESGAQLMGRSVRYETLDDGIAVVETLARELTGAAGISLGAVNPAFTPGLFIQGGVGGVPAAGLVGREPPLLLTLEAFKIMEVVL